MPVAPCDVCGNPIGLTEDICPHCGSLQEREQTGIASSPPITLRTVSLKQGLPSVSEATEALRHELKTAANDGVSVLKLIHGYGSSGKGGAIRDAVRQILASWAKKGLIKAWYTGEEYFDMGRKNNRLIRIAPELLKTWTGDKDNPGITLVEL